MSKLSNKRSGRRVGAITVLKEGAPGGMKKFRCPVSQQLAVPTTRSDGSRVFRTPNGVEYITRKL